MHPSCARRLGAIGGLVVFSGVAFLIARAAVPLEPSDPPRPPQLSALAIGLIVVTVYNFIKLPFMVQAGWKHGWKLPNMVKCPVKCPVKYTYSPPVFRPAGIDIEIHAAPHWLVFHEIVSTVVESIYISKELGYLTVATAAAPLFPTLWIFCATLVPMRNNIGPMPADMAAAANWYAIVAIAVGGLANVFFQNAALHYTLFAIVNLPTAVDVVAVAGVIAVSIARLFSPSHKDAAGLN
jgi:hypothetical protein